MNYFIFSLFQIFCFAFLLNVSPILGLDDATIRETPLHLRAMPLIGRYNPRLYDFAYLEGMIRLHHRQLEAFPEAIKTRLAGYSEGELDLFILIYADDFLSSGPAQRNLVFHTCAFPDAQSHETHNGAIQAGLFQPYGVKPEGAQSISFNAFSPQAVVIHPSDGLPAFSPDNCRFLFDTEYPIASFFTAAELPGHRAVACFAVVVHDRSNYYGEVMRHACSQDSPIDFLISLLDVELPPDIIEPISTIFAHYGEE